MTCRRSSLYFILYTQEAHALPPLPAGVQHTKEQQQQPQSEADSLWVKGAEWDDWLQAAEASGADQEENATAWWRKAPGRSSRTCSTTEGVWG